MSLTEGQHHYQIEFSDSESESDLEIADKEETFDDARAEIESYKREDLLGQEDDPLLWWSKKKDKFPLLANLFKKYLCVPATSVKAERTFYGLVLLLTKQRLSMGGGNVDRQLFMRDKFRKQSSLVNAKFIFTQPPQVKQ